MSRFGAGESRERASGVKVTSESQDSNVVHGVRACALTHVDA